MSYRKSLAYRLMAERKINGLETVLVEGTEFLLGKHLPAHGGSQPWHCRMVGLTLVFWGASLTSSPPSAFWKQVHQLLPSLLPLKVLCQPALGRAAGRLHPASWGTRGLFFTACHHVPLVFTR